MPVKLAECGVEIRATSDRMPFTQSGVAESWCGHYQYCGRCRRQIMRDQLLEKIVRELGKFVLELKLNPRGEKRRPLEKTADQRVDAVFQDTAQPLGNPRIFVCKFARL